MSGRVFQIGYSKSGTASLCLFFKMNGVSSIHYDYGKLARQIALAAKSNGNLLKGYEKVVAFFDMQAWQLSGAHEGFVYFDKLDEQYPGSKFILNTRPAERWLRSVRSHWVNDINLLAEMKRRFRLDEAGLLERRERHHARVIEYFRDRPEDLLVFDIEKDNGEKLCRFFRERWPKMNARKWGHWNKTSARNRPPRGHRGKMRIRPLVTRSSRRR